MIKIERLPASRWKECRDLRLEALKEEPLSFGSSYEEELHLSEAEWKERSGNALFALKDDIVIGMIVTIRESHLKARHIANIFAMYVRKKHRGKGVGDQLVKHTIEALRKDNSIRKIKLAVNSEQKMAVELYKKHGFEITGVLKKELCYQNAYYDELIMELYL